MKKNKPPDSTPAENGEVDEYFVKSIFVFNITRSVEMYNLIDSANDEGKYGKSFFFKQIVFQNIQMVKLLKSFNRFHF